MKIETQKLRCDECGIEALLYSTEEEGYDFPVRHDRSSWHNLHLGEEGSIKILPEYHFCSLVCLEKWVIDLRKLKEKENGKKK